ncbi:unnamed protein product [Brugia timori]|uniref:EGF-like domain-containing protein n=1 Tax=Brugia timori TaxID=42155 RepID=A0A0R3R5Z7_9BILA|nr:unnamed protein product [Brugia timori]
MIYLITTIVVNFWMDEMSFSENNCITKGHGSWSNIIFAILASGSSEGCNMECENGGKVKNDCNCQCAYGFEGKNCEELSRRKLFTDPSCGIHSDEQGTVSLRLINFFYFFQIFF